MNAQPKTFAEKTYLECLPDGQQIVSEADALELAAVLPEDRTHRGKFYEMMLETNRGNEFRIFEERAAAESWLVEGSERVG